MHESINLLIQLCFQVIKLVFLVISVQLFWWVLEDQVHLRSIENGERAYPVLCSINFLIFQTYIFNFVLEFFQHTGTRFTFGSS